MKQNITFLLGAGASYNSIPLVSTMNPRMKLFSSFIKGLKSSHKLESKFADSFIALLEKVIKADNENTSIDAYARMLSHQQHGSMELVRLKAMLSSYLLFEQLEKPDDIIFNSHSKLVGGFPHSVPYSDDMHDSVITGLDKRYKTFFLETTDRNMLPDNVNILSWNYDMQIELAHSKIFGSSLEEAQQKLQVYPSNHHSIDTNKSCVIKLNGTAGMTRKTSNAFFTNWFDLSKDELMSVVTYLIDIVEVNNVRSNDAPEFYFAWEKSDVTDKSRRLAKDIMQKTDVLVVIGYSFPRFNFEVDREIFKDLSRLQKIYYQAPKDDVESHIDSLARINPNLRSVCKSVTKLNTFYVPPEL